MAAQVQKKSTPFSNLFLTFSRLFHSCVIIQDVSKILPICLDCFWTCSGCCFALCLTVTNKCSDLIWTCLTLSVCFQDLSQRFPDLFWILMVFRLVHTLFCLFRLVPNLSGVVRVVLQTCSRLCVQSVQTVSRLVPHFV